MKLNLTVTLTLTLLVLMGAAAAASAMLGFKIGHQALQGVQEPDIRATNQLRGHRGKILEQEPGGMEMVKEADVLASVNKWIQSRGKHVKPEPPQQEEQSNTSKQKSVAKNQPPTAQKHQPGFPIATQNQGVQLEVVSSHVAGGSLVLNVNMKNTGNRDVRFLYSFMDLMDDQGQALSATTDGLPEELPANGQNFSGTVSIPTDTLDNVKKISMTLTDYPDQELRLQLFNIPVVK